MILHLGVFDLPYAQAPSPRQNKPSAGTVTTGDVAGWLEGRYHIMEIFFEQHKEDVAADLEEGLQGSLESLLLGAPPSLAPFGSGLSKIDERFKRFLSDKEMDRLGYPGVPTMAAQRGVSHRFKRPYVRRAPRPSFVDTGTYLASFKSWID